MKCANCGTERSIGKFCPECGSQEIAIEKKAEDKTEIKCGNCGRIRARGKFCPACGSQEVYVEPQVMVCSDCGTVRKSGKFCSECGSTNITYKPASFYENTDIQEPVYIPNNNTEVTPATPVVSDNNPNTEINNNNTTVDTDSSSEKSIKEPLDEDAKTSEEKYWELIDKKASIDTEKAYVINDIPDDPLEEAKENISINDDISDNPFKPMDIPNLNEETTEILKDDDDFEVFLSSEPNPTKIEKTPIAPLHNDFVPQELPIQNKADETSKTKSDASEAPETKSYTSGAIETKSDISEVKKPKASQIDNAEKDEQSKLEKPIKPEHPAKPEHSSQPKSQTSLTSLQEQPYKQVQTFQQDKSYQQAQTFQQDKSYQQTGAYQQNQSYQQNQPNQWHQPYQMQNLTYQQSDNTYYNYNGYGANDGYIVKQPRQRNTAPLTPTGETLKKCRIAIFILTALEFIAMFLPAATYSNGLYSESVSLSDGHGFIIFVGLIILTILAILAGFSNYVGCAIGLLIQSLILSIASFFIVALVSEDREASKGIAYFIFLIVPIVIIIISIAVVRLSIRLKVETTNTNQL